MIDPTLMLGAAMAKQHMLMMEQMQKAQDLQKKASELPLSNPSQPDNLTTFQGANEQQKYLQNRLYDAFVQFTRLQERMQSKNKRISKSAYITFDNQFGIKFKFNHRDFYNLEYKHLCENLKKACKEVAGYPCYKKVIKEKRKAQKEKKKREQKDAEIRRISNEKAEEINRKKTEEIKKKKSEERKERSNLRNRDRRRGLGNGIGKQIRERLGKQTGELTSEDFLQIMWLRLEGKKISDLSPFLKFSNLESLHLSNNNISDLQPIIGLKRLKCLDLSNNQIRSISPLEEIWQLKIIDLRGNSDLKLRQIKTLKKVLSNCDVRHEKSGPVGSLFTQALDSLLKRIMD
jgi:hypothetical protein